jgi:replication-associated recombination protein RarA
LSFLSSLCLFDKLHAKLIEDQTLQKNKFHSCFFFCAGCGKKRSDESLGSLIDFNQEPPVAELNRQIMSEAKLWEAIQEARNELLRQRHQVTFPILFYF